MADPQPQPVELIPLDASDVPPEVADPDSKYMFKSAAELRSSTPAAPAVVVDPAPKPSAPAPEATVVTRAPAPKPDPQPAPIAPFAGVPSQETTKGTATPMASQQPQTDKPAAPAAPASSTAPSAGPGPAVIVEKQDATPKPAPPPKQPTQPAEQNKPKPPPTRDAAVVVVEKEPPKSTPAKEPAVIVVEKDQSKPTAAKDAPIVVVEKDPAKTPPAAPSKAVEVVKDTKPAPNQAPPHAVAPENVKVEAAEQSKGQVKEHHYRWLTGTKREKLHLFLRKNHLQLLHSHEDPAEVQKRKVEHAEKAHDFTRRTRDKLRMLYWGHAAQATVKAKV